MPSHSAILPILAKWHDTDALPPELAFVGHPPVQTHCDERVQGTYFEKEVESPCSPVPHSTLSAVYSDSLCCDCLAYMSTLNSVYYSVYILYRRLQIEVQPVRRISSIETICMFIASILKGGDVMYAPIAPVLSPTGSKRLCVHRTMPLLYLTQYIDWFIKKKTVMQSVHYFYDQVIILEPKMQFMYSIISANNSPPPPSFRGDI